MTNETSLTNAQRQAAFRAKRLAEQALASETIKHLTAENERLEALVKSLTEASKRAKVQHVANIARLRGQVIKLQSKE